MGNKWVEICRLVHSLLRIANTILSTLHLHWNDNQTMNKHVFVQRHALFILYYWITVFVMVIMFVFDHDELSPGLGQWSCMVLVAAVRPSARPCLPDYVPVPVLLQRPPGTPSPCPRVLLSELAGHGGIVATTSHQISHTKWNQWINAQ